MSGTDGAEGSVELWNYSSRRPPRLRRKLGNNLYHFDNWLLFSSLLLDVFYNSSEMPGVSFLPFSILLGVLGILCVGFTVYWSHHWLGGFAWDGSAQMFNWHPVLMVTGMLVLYGTAALVYRVPLSWEGPKFPWKLLHASLAMTAFILIVLGLVAVFESKSPTPYSMLPPEAWFGNVLGMLILVFALLVLWALARPAWKRPDVSLEDNREPLLYGAR
ncbi:hypothetical protein JD844_022087 [Phrynosoma platyrhinos]|uniref:Lysosomal membrane ascorbate-dependent ferrireductase CYB561A3 n=1 Tax=Phrynosoma platyrhinos TaxID=52577 RepID=A0ABQ7SUN4_PHRPL|nr:hypothetical protein JD844_022087 [Phrynosoma platyrhinos]